MGVFVGATFKLAGMARDDGSQITDVNHDLLACSMGWLNMYDLGQVGATAEHRYRNTEADTMLLPDSRIVCLDHSDRGSYH